MDPVTTSSISMQALVGPVIAGAFLIVNTLIGLAIRKSSKSSESIAEAVKDMKAEQIEQGKKIVEVATLVKDSVLVTLKNHERRLDKGSEKFDDIEDRMVRVETRCESRRATCNSSD